MKKISHSRIEVTVTDRNLGNPVADRYVGTVPKEWLDKPDSVTSIVCENEYGSHYPNGEPVPFPFGLRIDIKRIDS